MGTSMVEFRWAFSNVLPPPHFGGLQHGGVAGTHRQKVINPGYPAPSLRVCTKLHYFKPQSTDISSAGRDVAQGCEASLAPQEDQEPSGAGAHVLWD